jgi:hypothetical protein
MSEAKKFEEVDLEKLKVLQDRFNNIVLQLGQIDIEIMKNQAEKERLVSLKDKLEEDYKILRTDEQSMASQLTEKYGAGILDPRTGDFTPQEKKIN